ncbi:MAG: glutathione S-transferase family protein [Elainellaceae cyanobacterium]
MLTFYYHPLSPIARRVWLALLEKQLTFELIEVNLKSGEQHQPEFSALNPFHHVPVLTDGDLTLVESLAILDYLDAKFPERSLSPTAPEAMARMRMVQMVIANELMTKLPLLVADPKAEALSQQLNTAFTFLSAQLGEQPYFGGASLSLADVVAGATLPLMCRLGVSFASYPTLEQWRSHIVQRPAWQQTTPSDAALVQWQRWVGMMVRRRRQQQAKAKQ